MVTSSSALGTGLYSVRTSAAVYFRRVTRRQILTVLGNFSDDAISKDTLFGELGAGARMRVRVGQRAAVLGMFRA